VTTSAPRIRPPLLEALARHDDPRVPIAEVCRRVGAEADRLGLTRPSYERIRELVHLLRRLRQKPRRGPSMLQLFLEAGAGLRGGPSLGDQVFRPREERL
jgi:hypothetical protein